ncbi:MAG: ABC transporter permease [Terriglobales bacterium]
MIDNLRFALRQIHKNPGFATLAILTLALGIGANTAMFTVIDSVMLRPLPYQDADQIVAITPGAASEGNSVRATSWINYLDIREQARQFRAVVAYAIDVAVVRNSQTSQGAVVVKTTASLFDALGVRPILGRPFTDSDNQPGAANVVILTAPFWREHFAANPHVVGQQVRIGNNPYTVVGVLPEGLSFSDSDASKGVWLPYQPDWEASKKRNSSFLYLMASLRPGVSLQAAQSELTSIARSIAQRDPEHAKDLAFRAIPLRNVVTAQVKPVFLALTGALILVLLIACANVANLQLARCLARAQELAVRTALGATRRALLMQMLVEGGVLCIAGAAVGVGLAQLMLDGIRHLPPDLIPRAGEIHLRLSVFLMLLLATTIVTLLSSMAPALVAMRSDPQAVLQAGSRGAAGNRGRSRLSGAMVAGEVALSVILLISGGLMFRTLYKLQHLYLGFEENNITSFMAMPGSAAGFFTQNKSASKDQADSIALRVYAPMAEKLRHLPGVVDVAFANALPFEGIDMHTSWQVVGRPRSPEDANKNEALLRSVSGRYQQVMTTPVLRGRAITDEDTAASPYVLTINETLAKRYFAGEDPIGKQIDFGGRTTKDRIESGMQKPYTIVGVMADSIQTKIAEPVIPEIDLPYPQIPIASFYHQFLVTSETNYVVKTHGPVDIASAIRNAFHESAPEFALDNFTTMQAAHDQADFNQRLGLYLVASFAGIAVVMVLAGLYGVLSQIVGQRRREIGIRMALGADRRQILEMMLRKGLLLISIGLAVGLLASLGTVRSLTSFLYGVSPVDAITYIGVIITLLLVGTLAALIPARRAASIEPTQALRAE